MNAAIAERRLDNQGLTKSWRIPPAVLVARLGAVQAQEYPFAKWGLALRLAGEPTDEAIERAFGEGRILRTHVMRPTWHFVARDDLRWMQELTAPRVQRLSAAYNRRQELDSRTLTRATNVFARALEGGRFLTRADLRVRLARAGLHASGMRLALIALHAELEGVICSGPRRGKDFTYALVAERAPAARRLNRDEALAELVCRYFTSHGPATIRDFVWWSGLTTADATRGLQAIGARHQVVDGLKYWTTGAAPRTTRRQSSAHLLPIYDEYLVSYRDRVAVPHGPRTVRSGSQNVTFQHALVVAGQVAGTWKLNRRGPEHTVEVAPLRRLTTAERRGIDAGVARYGKFLGAALSVRVA